MNSPSPEANALPEVIMITKKSAAIGQLEGAISIWFEYGSPVAILTLATAANDCYHALGTMKGRPSVIQARLKTLSKKDQDAARAAQNFAKHGMRDVNKAVPYIPEHGEILILDSLLCHEHLFKELTPLMSAFDVHYSVLHPRFLRPGISKSLHSEMVAIHKRMNLDRRSFLKYVLPGLASG